MKLDQLRRRVERCEDLLQARGERTRANWSQLKTTWRDSWTPGRILAIGVVGGFLFARAKPMRAIAAISATRWIQLATSVSGLMASLKAATAAESAESAATGAESAAHEAADSADVAAAEVAAAPTAGTAQVEVGDESPRPVSDRRRRPDPQWESAPRPAEAATELSER